MAATRLPLAGLAHLLVTWVVWGSTYMAIRIAVREGAGFGPLWLGASRVATAGVLLLLFNVIRRRSIRPRPVDLAVLAATGLLMWVGGNGAVNWAVQRVDSGLAALIVGTMPMWVAIFEAILDRRPPTWTLSLSIASGFGGLVVLSWPMLADGIDADVIGVVAVAAGTASWGLGSLVLNRRPVRLPASVISGFQQLLGAVGFVVLALAVGESTPTPTTEAWAAWGYLVVFGSVLAFTSYMSALRLLPTSVVMTYTYVNPVIAVVLGWLLLDEPVTGYTLSGMVLVVVGVLGVFRNRSRGGPGRKE